MNSSAISAIFPELYLSDEEKERAKKGLVRCADYTEKLNELDTEGLLRKCPILSRRSIVFERMKCATATTEKIFCPMRRNARVPILRYLRRWNKAVEEDK